MNFCYKVSSGNKQTEFYSPPAQSPVRYAQQVPMKQLLLTLTILHAIAAYGQLSGKYSSYSKTRDHYILFNSDSSFEYHYQYDVFGDHLMGTYTVNGNTVKFQYVSNYNSNASDSIVHSAPPDSLFLERDTLFEISKGKIKRKTDKYQIDYKPKGAERQQFRRKYIFFGPFFSKRRPTYYMRKDEKSISSNR